MQICCHMFPSICANLNSLLHEDEMSKIGNIPFVRDEASSQCRESGVGSAAQALTLVPVFSSSRGLDLDLGRGDGETPRRSELLSWTEAIPENSQERLLNYSVLLENIFADQSYSNQLELYIPKLIPYLIKDIACGENSMTIPSIDVLAWILSGEACDLGVHRTKSAISKAHIVASQCDTTSRGEHASWEAIEAALLSAASSSYSYCSDAAAQYHAAVLATIFFLLHENKVFCGVWRHRGEWLRLAVACLSRPSTIPETTRLRAFDVFNKLFSGNEKNEISPIVEVVMNSDVGACLISASPQERRCYFEFLETLLIAEGQGVVIRSEMQIVKNAMETLLSALTTATLQDVFESASRVGPAWRLWMKCIARGVPNRKLKDFLRDGSSDAFTAGFVLRPVEFLLLHTPLRLEGCRCWRALAEQFVATENWSKDNKVLKLLLRCCIDIFENEQDRPEVISVVADTVNLMLRHSWPLVETILDFEVRSNCTLRLFLQQILAQTDLPSSKGASASKIYLVASLLHLHEPPNISPSTLLQLKSDSDLMRMALQHGKTYTWFLSKMNDVVMFWRLISTSRDSPGSDANQSDFGSIIYWAKRASNIWTLYIDLVGNYLVSFDKGMNMPNIMSQFTPPNNAGRETQLMCGSPFPAGIVLSADDAPGTEKPVLASTSPLAAAVILEITSMALDSSVWDQNTNNKFWAIKTRETALSSLMNLSHKVSAFDLMPADNSLNDRVIEIWTSLISSRDPVYHRGSASDRFENKLRGHGTLGSCIFLLAIGQAYCFENLALDIDHADSFSRTVTRSIQRSMNSILECRALPDMLAWLPIAVRSLIARRKPGENIQCHEESGVFSIFLVRDSKQQLKESVSCLDRIIGCIASCASRALAKMPIGDELVHEYSQKQNLSSAMMKANLVGGLLKLVSLPALLLQGSRCFSIFHFGKYGTDKISQEMLPWKKLFKIIANYAAEDDILQLCNFIPDSVHCRIDPGIINDRFDQLRCSESIIEFIQYAVAVVDYLTHNGEHDDCRKTEVGSVLEQSHSSIHCKSNLAQLAAKLLILIIFNWGVSLWSIATNLRDAQHFDALKQLCATTLAGEIIRAILLVDQILDDKLEVKFFDYADCPLIDGFSSNPSSFGVLSLHLLFIGIPKAICSKADPDLNKLYSSFLKKILCEISFAANNQSLNQKYQRRLLAHLLEIERLSKESSFAYAEMDFFNALSDLISEIRKRDSNHDRPSEVPPKDLFGFGRSKRDFLPSLEDSSTRITKTEDAINGKRVFGDTSVRSSIDSDQYSLGPSETAKRLRIESTFTRLNSLHEIVQCMKNMPFDVDAVESREEWNDLIRRAEVILMHLKRA